jgi:ABC-type glycerol-3-phosphate transport system substrate-binding protein
MSASKNTAYLRSNTRFNRRKFVGKSGAAVGAMAAGSFATGALPSTSSVVAQEEPVTLKFITLGEAWADHMQQVIEGFVNSHPNIQVELETYPFRQLFEVIEIQMQGQSPDVDVISVDVPLVASYTVRGFLHPLDEYFTAEEIETTWIPAASEAGTFNDQFMAAPQNNSTQFLYFNRTLFEENGVEPPPAMVEGTGGEPGLIDEVVSGRWTWEQVVDAAEQLTLESAGVTDVWGLIFDQVSRPYQMLALPESLGQPSISPDGLTTDGYLNSEAWIRAATFYYDLFNTWGVSPTGVEPDQTTELFASGRVAMFVGGEWNIPTLANTDGLDFAIAAHPYFADGEVATPTGSWHAGVSAFSEQKDAAAEFVKYLTASPEGSQIWYDAHGHFPATTELLEAINTSEETESFPQSAYRLGVYEAQNTAVPRPQSPGYLEFEDILNNTLEDIRNGSDPEEALNAAVQRIDRGLERYRDI